MQIHQLGYIVDHLLGVLQRPKPLADHLCADHFVVMEADPAIGLVPTRRGLADVMQQRRPPQHQIGFTRFLQRDRLPQHRQRVLVDVLVLMVFVDGHLHATDLGQNHIAEPGPHHQFDTRYRIHAKQHLVQFDSDPLDGDTGQFRRHRDDRLPHSVGHPEPKLRYESRGAQHSQRIVSEGHRRRGRGVQDPLLYRRQSTQRVQELPRAVRGDPHGHRVGGEVAPHQVVLEAIPEAHLRVAGHLVVAVSPKSGDLQSLVRLTHADGAVVDPGIPHRVGPRTHDLLHRLRPSVSGEVEVSG